MASEGQPVAAGAPSTRCPRLRIELLKHRPQPLRTGHQILRRHPRLAHDSHEVDVAVCRGDLQSWLICACVAMVVAGRRGDTALRCRSGKPELTLSSTVCLRTSPRAAAASVAPVTTPATERLRIRWE